MAENLEFNTDIKVNADTSEAKENIDDTSSSLEKASKKVVELSEKLETLNSSLAELKNSLSSAKEEFEDARDEGLFEVEAIYDINIGKTHRSTAESLFNEEYSTGGYTPEDIPKDLSDLVEAYNKYYRIADMVKDVDSESKKVKSELKEARSEERHQIELAAIAQKEEQEAAKASAKEQDKINKAVEIATAKEKARAKQKEATAEANKRAKEAGKEAAQSIRDEYNASVSASKGLKTQSDYTKEATNETNKLKASSNNVNKSLTAFGKLSVDAFEKVISKTVELGKEVWDLGLAFEKSSQKMRTLVDESAVSFDSLQKQLLSISSTYGESIDSVNESAYQALSASVKTEDLLTILDVAQKASIAGFTDSTTAIDGLTSVINAYGMSVEDADDLANKFLITQNLGKTTFGEIASSIGQIAPNAKIVGLSIDDVLAAIATLTAQGVTTDEAITQLNGAINSIIDPSKEAKEAAEQLGVEFNGEALRSKGLIQFLREIKDAAGDDNDALTDMFGNIRGFKALAGLTEGEDKFNEALYQMQNNTTALDDAFAKMTDTVSFSKDRLKESIKGIGALTFEGLKDPIKDFVDYLNENAESILDALSLNGLDESVYTSISNLLDTLKESFYILSENVGPELLELLINIVDILNVCFQSLNYILDASEPILSIINSILGAVSKINPELLLIIASIVSLNSVFVTLNKSLGAFASMNLAGVLSTLAAKFASTSIEASVFVATLQTGFLGAGKTIATFFTTALPAMVVPAMAPILVVGGALIAAALGLKHMWTELEKINEMKLEGPNFAEQANKDIEALKEEKKAFDDLIEASKEKEESENASINRLKSLWDELESLTDANGNIIENEERAKQIINLLNENYDMNIEYQGNMIEGYKQLSNSMDSYIENLRKESRIRNNQEAYDKALENYDKLNERKKQLEEEIELDLKSFETAYAKYEAGDRDYLDVAGVFAEQRGANMQVLQEIEAEQQEYLKTIEEYEDLFKEDTEEVIDDTFDYIEVKTEDSKKTVEEYLDDIDKLNSDALDNYKSGLDAELNEYEKMLDKKAEAVEEFYDKQLEQQEAAHNKIISDIEAEYALETGKIDEDEYNRELNKMLSERDKIQKKINQYGSMDTLKTSEDRKELASLQKELESQNEKIAEKQHDREVSLKKAELKEKADLAKDAENSRWEQEKESINKSKTEAVNAQKEANAAELDDFKNTQSAKEKAFKEAQEQMLEEVKTFSADSLAVLTSDWGTYVDSMTGTFKGALADLSTSQKDVFLSSSEAMQQAITDVRESLSESIDDLSEYMDKIDTIKELQSLPPERIAAKASALDLTVEEALQLKDVDLKMLTEGMTYTIKSAGTVDNSVTNTNSNNITYNYYYNGEKTKQTTYAGAVR